MAMLLRAGKERTVHRSRRLALERDRSGAHGQFMKYELSSIAEK
jgi:hypothetical protein